MRVLVTGATGLVGNRLCTELIRHHHELIVIGRSSEKKFRQKFIYPCEYLTWEELEKLTPIDAVFHLAGESIAGLRWTSAKKKSILNSRVDTTRALIKALDKSSHWPAVFISASAVGYYGDRGDELLCEDASSGEGFLAEVCEQWENASTSIKPHSRVVHLRFGVVLDRQGGFLEPMEKLFSKSLGGKVGSGKQWMSWIHYEDLVQIMIFVLNHKEAQGPINAVAPHPITNNQWTTAYSQKLGVRALLPVPSFALKIALGEMSQLALASQKASAQKILDLGFQFKYKNIETALNDLYR